MTIDFITVSRRPAMVERLRLSIGHWIGTTAAWNLSAIDGKAHDLFTGYNAGAAQTRGEILAFVHDDVQFLGNPLTLVGPMERLRGPRTGFVGVAGSEAVRANVAWWQAPQACRGMVAHGAPGDFGVAVNVWPPGCAAFGKVAVLDGVLLMCNRRVFDELGGFDSASYKGFHFYDIDITFRAAVAKLENFAAPIPLLHDSGGTLPEEWAINRDIFQRKFGHLLPARVIP